jgi:hypothetical protein
MVNGCSDPSGFSSCGGCCGPALPSGVSRRAFLEASGIGLSTLAVAKTVAAGGGARQEAPAPTRVPLVVKPLLTYEVPKRREQTSWRAWGGVQTEQAAREEMARIDVELAGLRQTADFPLAVLPVSGLRAPDEVARVEDLRGADAIVIYAAGGPMTIFEAAVATGKPVVFFLRHRSGPVSLWYEIISPRYLHQHGDGLGAKGVSNDDVVVDKVAELEWRLRALCGAKNARDTKIVAIGGPDGWGPSGREAPAHAKEKWRLDIQTVSYDELKPLLASAMADAEAGALARRRADEYLRDPGVTLETDRVFVEHAFLLDGVFRGLMERADARAITVNHCMGAIMPLAKTTACLALSTLNDAGYLAFCESDFVVIPAGILLASISGRPQFLNDPTYPHGGVITLAHCTAPRKLDGTALEPARIVTHFESDCGAAPKVEMRKGQVVTNVIPDFASARYVGLRGTIVDSPFLPICRSQIDVAYAVRDEQLALNMPGFHWETVYGDYLRETGYALQKIGIGWELLA